jgi:trigger factor
MATVVRENVGTLTDKLIIKITKEDYTPNFDKKIKEYSKQANIPGFRKGQVPVDMVKRMYGSSIFVDEVLKTVEGEVYKYLTTEKPEIFAQPMPLETNDPSKLDFKNPTDYEFGFEIGLKPVFEIAPIEKAKVTLHKVTVTPEMIDEEIENMRTRAAKPEDASAVAHTTDIVHLTANQKTLVRAVDYFTDAAQKELLNKKPTETVTLTLTTALDADKVATIAKELGIEEAAASEPITFTVDKAQALIKPELDEAFFKEVYPTKEVKTLDELKASLTEEMQGYWNSQSSNQLQDQLYHYVLDETKMEFPADFLKRFLQNGGEKPKTAEEAEKEYPGFETQLKWTLISDKLIADNKVTVNMDDVKEFMKQQVMGYFGTMQLGEDTSWLDAYVDRMLKDEKQVDQTYRRLITEKLFGILEAQAKPTEKTVTSKELTDLIKNHKH